MKKGYSIAIAGLVSLIVLLALIILPRQVADAATGCTCPTGCATRTVQNAPFTLSGLGEYCIESTNLGAYVQSWGTDQLNITGVDYTNMYMVTDQILRDTTGKYFVYYKSTTGNGNFSTNGTSDITNCTMSWCSSAQFGSMLFGQYTMYNNVWGATTGTGQSIQSNGPAQWRTFSTFPETSGVKSYPNASLDLNGKTINTLGSCTSSFNVTMPSGGSNITSYDIWVPSEIMLWMNKQGNVGPIAQAWNDDGTPVVTLANVTVGGHTWDVYRGGANVISFVRQGNINSGTIDILAILNWTASQGWISNTSNLGKFQFGFEITSAPGGLNFVTNSYSMSCGGLGGGVTAVPSPTRTNTPSGPTLTPTRTATRTNTPIGPTFTPTRTATRTNTPLGPSATPTRTATRTLTPTGPTATLTRTLTPVSGGTCSPVTSTITAPFTFDGAGTLCWQSSNLGAYINSWNMANLTVNGVDFTNLYVPAGGLPAKINGFWYVSYTGNFPWSHFEAK
jgi:xyloglucan-specific endo-beta-1,4-glucanase